MSDPLRRGERRREQQLMPEEQDVSFSQTPGVAPGAKEPPGPTALVLAFVTEHALTLGVGALALAFMVGGKVSPGAAQRAVDIDLLLVLFALLTAVEMLRQSGYLDRIVA